MPKKMGYNKGNRSGAIGASAGGGGRKGGGAPANRGQIKGGNKSVVAGSPPKGWRAPKA